MYCFCINRFVYHTLRLLKTTLSVYYTKSWFWLKNLGFIKENPESISKTGVNFDFFVTAQLNEIRKASVARLLCDVGDGIYEVPKNAIFNISPK